MRFRQFFIAHENDFFVAFLWLSGACTVLILVAAVQSSAVYFLAALICFALSAAIWLYGHKLQQERLIELEESLRNSGSKEKTAWTKESGEKALNITQPRSSN